MLKKKTLLKSNINGFDRKNEKTRKKLSKFEIRNSNIVNGGHILQRKLKETIILDKYDLKWKETSEKCKWEHRTR